MEKKEKGCSRISGYLEKKGKKKMISSYKKYWFVLEGGLLLYYRSKDDYEGISPCKGSINLGPPCIVKPCPSLPGVFQIQTRIATVTLRAENRDEQNKWMQAIICEVSPQKNLQRMSHFRYSLENIPQTKEPVRNSTPESESSHNSSEDIIHRLQKLGAQSYNPRGSVNKMATLKHNDRTPLPDVEISNVDSKSTEHIYERISAEFRESLLGEKNVQEENSMALPPQDFAQNNFIIDNDTYVVSVQQKDKKSKQRLKHTKSFFSKRKSKEESFMIENDHYAFIQKDKNSSDDNASEFTDHNENNLLNNEARKIEEENAYSIPDFFAESEEIYKDVKKANVEYAEPTTFQVEENKNKEIVEETDKKKSKMKLKKEEKGQGKLKKRHSFIRRVWRKKDKNKEKEKTDDRVEEEDLYETVPASVVEKLAVTNNTTVQMLSELQNILEQKVPILIEKISLDLSPTNSDPHETDEKLGNTVQDVSQKLPDSPIINSNIKKSEPSPRFQEPPPVALPPKKNKKIGAVKSLDEILDELNTQKSNTNTNKVKKLIKRFSEPEFFESDVILRNGRRNNGQRDEIGSCELSRLLEELAKVTNAPILTPGVTSSLHGANMPDEEFAKLLPTKQRRFSEPDYDIPRPHKSLTITQKRDQVTENVIGSTRFFGPILKPSDMIVPSESLSSDPLSQLNSITPDSLETNLPLQSNQEIDENPYSHKYYKFVDRRLFYNKNNLSYPPTSNIEPVLQKSVKDISQELIIDNDIYAEPRSISLNFELSQNKNLDYEDDEVFVDSLEVCKNEISTEF